MESNALLPAVPGIDVRFRLKLNETLKSSTSVNMRTQSSNDVAFSRTEVKFLSNPTVTSEC